MDEHLTVMLGGPAKRGVESNVYQIRGCFPVAVEEGAKFAETFLAFW